MLVGGSNPPEGTEAPGAGKRSLPGQRRKPVRLRRRGPGFAPDRAPLCGGEGRGQRPSERTCRQSSRKGSAAGRHPAGAGSIPADCSRRGDLASQQNGEASRWATAPVLKTDERTALWVRLPPSPPLEGCAEWQGSGLLSRDPAGFVGSSPTPSARCAGSSGWYERLSEAQEVTGSNPVQHTDKRYTQQKRT